MPSNPTLVTTPYQVDSAGADASTLTSPSFTPNPGEVIVVKCTTWSTGQTFGTPTATGLTFTQKAVIDPGGFAGYTTIFAATAPTTPVANSGISATPSASCRHTMVVERLTGAQLAVTPVTVTAAYSSASAPSVSFTTSADNSFVTFSIEDAQAVSPSTRAFIPTGTYNAVDEGLWDGSATTDGVFYFSYVQLGPAGTYTIGMSAPSTQKWVIAAMEVLAIPDNAGGMPQQIPTHLAYFIAQQISLRADAMAAASTDITAADSPMGIRVGDATTVTVAAGITVADTPTGTRVGGATSTTVTFDVAVSDTPVGVRMGVSATSVAADVVVADSPSGTRQGGDTTSSVTVSVTASDVPAGVRVGLSATGVLFDQTAADSPVGQRVGVSSIVGVFNGIAVSDSPLAVRVGDATTTSVTIDVVATDTPTPLRLGISGTSVAVSVAIPDLAIGIRAGVSSAAVTYGVTAADQPIGTRVGVSPAGVATPVSASDAPYGVRVGISSTMVSIVTPPAEPDVIVHIVRTTVVTHVARGQVSSNVDSPHVTVDIKE